MKIGSPQAEKSLIVVIKIKKISIRQIQYSNIPLFQYAMAFDYGTRR